MRNVCGINYSTTLEFEDFSLLIAQNSLLLLLKDRAASPTLRTWLKISRILTLVSRAEDLKLQVAFGVFLDRDFATKKKKIRGDFLKNLSGENFIFLLEGSNEDGYYTNRHNTENFIGLEFRLQDSNLLDTHTGRGLIEEIKLDLVSQT